MLIGFSRSVSLVAGPPPLTSTPAVAPSLQMITVQPVDVYKRQEQFASLGSNGLNVEKVTTLQQNLDQLIPGLSALLLTLLCCWLLKKKVSPIVIIVALFIIGILARLGGIM